MKAGCYTQLYIQLVIAVKHRDSQLHKSIRKRVLEYISGIVSQLGHKSIIVNGVSDHLHIFFGLNPNVSISDTVHDIKRSTSLFINNEKLLPVKFYWQSGYGAFSYSRSQLERVYNYILHQEEHHTCKTFKEEYIGILKKYKVEFNEQYLFEFFN